MCSRERSAKFPLLGSPVAPARYLAGSIKHIGCAAMKSILPVVLAIAFVTPVRGDDCSDFRLAVRERDSARKLLLEGEADEERAGKLISDDALSAIRLDRVVQDLVAHRGDDVAARILRSLDEADHAVIKALADTSALPGDPQDPSYEDLDTKVLLAGFAIDEARNALARTLCP